MISNPSLPVLGHRAELYLPKFPYLMGTLLKVLPLLQSLRVGQGFRFFVMDVASLVIMVERERMETAIK